MDSNVYFQAESKEWQKFGGVDYVLPEASEKYLTLKIQKMLKIK